MPKLKKTILHNFFYRIVAPVIRFKKREAKKATKEKQG